MLISGVGTHSHFLIDQSSFFACGFCVFEKKMCLRGSRAKVGFFKPKEENGLSRVQAVYKPYPKSLTYYMVNATWGIRHVSDRCPVRVRVSNTRTLHKVAVSVFQRFQPRGWACG